MLAAATTVPTRDLRRPLFLALLLLATALLGGGLLSAFLAPPPERPLDVPVSFPVGLESQHYLLPSGVEVILVRDQTGGISAYSARSPRFGRRLKYVPTAERARHEKNVYFRDSDAAYNREGIAVFGPDWGNLDWFPLRRLSDDRVLLQDTRWVNYGWCSERHGVSERCSIRGDSTAPPVLRRHRASAPDEEHSFYKFPRTGVR